MWLHFDKTRGWFWVKDKFAHKLFNKYTLAEIELLLQRLKVYEKK